MEKVLKKKRALVNAIIYENIKDIEIDEELFIDEKDGIFFSILLSYIEIKRSEYSSERISPEERKEKVDEVYKKSLLYIESVIECSNEIEVKGKDKILKVLEHSISGYSITREDKIFILQEKNSIRERLFLVPCIDYLLIYCAIETAMKIEVVRKEKSILSFDRSNKNLNTPAEDKKTPIFIQRIEKTIHPIRITGRATKESIKKLLTLENSPTLSVEEYGERILAVLKARGIDPTVSPVVKETEEEVSSSSDQEKQTEEHRKKKEKEEYINYGDGNRKGRK